jgi:hypothetical protein
VKVWRMTALAVAVFSALSLGGCAQGGGWQSGYPALTCNTLSPSVPYKTGLLPDSPGRYQFTMRADGTVTCTGQMAEVSVTVELHYGSGGASGVFSGETVTCVLESRCVAFAQYHRGGLACDKVTRYEDYAQLTVEFKARSSDGPNTVHSREGRHAVGELSRPGLVGCS